MHESSRNPHWTCHRSGVRGLAFTLVVGTACTAEPTIDTHVELRFIEGVSELPGDGGWHTSAAGHVGVVPWARNGPTPDAGDCVAWLLTADPGEISLPPPDPILEIDDIGSFRIVEYPGGDLEVASDALPPSPFLVADRGITLRLDADRAVNSTVPHTLELASPPSGAAISLHDPIPIEWTADGEHRIAITLALFSSQLVFRGAVNCTSEGAAHFELRCGPVS